MNDGFVWDEAKRVANLRKHGIDFLDVGPAFDDPNQHLTVEYVEGEERWRLIGAMPNGIVLVVYVEQQPRIRLISARLATNREKRTYYQGAAY